MRKDAEEVLCEHPLSKHPETMPRSCSLQSKKEAADYLGVSTRTFDRIQKDRVIPFVLVGSRRRYLLSDLDSYIKSRRSI